MKELKELIKKILITLAKRKIRNYVIYITSGCGIFLLKIATIIIILLISLSMIIWGINTFLKNVSNPEGVFQKKTEQVFKKALEKPKAKEINTTENIKQENQHEENTEEKEKQITEEIKTRENLEKKIKCIGSGCDKPKQGKIIIKESK